jgi:hypothetical protein
MDTSTRASSAIDICSDSAANSNPSDGVFFCNRAAIIHGGANEHGRRVSTNPPTPIQFIGESSNM